jgi:hypothetical protein
MTSASDTMGWMDPIATDRQSVRTQITPEGKRWECCATCQGTGKVLVDENMGISRTASVGTGASDEKRYP